MSPGLVWARAGAVFYVLWGILHVVAAFAILEPATAGLEPGIALARLQQNSVFMALAGLTSVWIAFERNWRNDGFGWRLNLFVVSVADIGFILLVLVPGYEPVPQGLSGPALWVLAALASTVGYSIARNEAHRPPQRPSKPKPFSQATERTAQMLTSENQSDSRRPLNILRVDGSARRAGSYSRDLTDKIVARLLNEHPGASLAVRDLANGDVLAVDEAWTVANNTAEDTRTPDQRSALALSDRLVSELKSADAILIGAPVYNFTVPAVLKAWIDQVCRARLTFAYTDAGPRGLLEGKRAIVVITSGGTSIGSEIDFASGYLRHILGFIGIREVEFIVADRLMFDGDAKIDAARSAIAGLRLSPETVVVSTGRDVGVPA